MTTAQAGAKKKRRKMKQMQGLLMLSRVDEAALANAKSRHAVKPRRMNVVLQPQQLQLAYSALEDQDMEQVLGRVDLRSAKLEQVPDGFVIYETSTASLKKVKLQDKDKATTDAWFFAVYTAISEFERMPIMANEDVGHKFSAVVSASLRDEATATVEFELSCQLVLPLRPVDKPSIKWKVWKTFGELQAFDDELRISYGSMMKRIIFPRDRKRDSLFGGMRKKALQELKEQQLALYVENVFQIPELSADPVLVDKVKWFLGFDAFFEIVPSPTDTDEAQNELAAPMTVDNDSTSELGDTIAPQVVAADMDPEQDKTFERHREIESNGNPPLSRRRSSAAFEDEGEEFVNVVPETDPKEAKRLHKNIVQTVRELVSFDEERVQEFQDQTKDFGRDKMSATEYCSFLLGAVGAHECLQLIPLMARLLPDEEKRDQLLAARAAIWRRAHRRHRRRSKQFSESVVLQQQKDELVKMESMNNRMRPKSDSLSALNWAAEHEPLQLGGRSSMIETRSAGSEASDKMRKSESEVTGPYFRPGLFDARRKLDKRPSFNMFGENITSEPIHEENPAANESDDENGAVVPQNAGGSLPTTGTGSRMLPHNSSAWTKPRPNSASSFLDEYDDEDSSIDDGSVRSRSSSNYLSARTGSFRRAKSRDGSARLHRRGSRHSSSFIEEAGHEREAAEEVRASEDDDNLDENDDSHTRFQKNRRRASRKFDVEAKTMSSPVEENPVLARLKKQGAVNFMMR